MDLEAFSTIAQNITALGVALAVAVAMVRGIIVPASVIKALVTEIVEQVMERHEEHRQQERKETLEVLGGGLRELSETLGKYEAARQRGDRDHQKWSEAEFDRLARMIRNRSLDAPSAQESVPESHGDIA